MSRCRAHWSLELNSAVVSEGLALRLTGVLLDTPNPRNDNPIRPPYAAAAPRPVVTDRSTHRPARAPLWMRSLVPTPNRTEPNLSSVFVQPPAHSPQPTAQPLNVSIPARCQKERSSAALLKVKRLRPSSPSAGKNTFFYDCCCPAGALGSSTFRNADVAFVTAVRMKTTVL